LDFPPIVTNISGQKVDAYLGGFNEIQLSISEKLGNENCVLFSSMDKFCLGIYPLKGGDVEGYYKQHADLEFLFDLMGFLPYIGNLINLATLASPNNYPSQIESINYSFQYEATMESNGKSPDGGRSPYVVNQFRWIVWIQPGCYVIFNFMMKLIETFHEGEFFEINKEIQVTAGENPVVL
jgi:hypothetical protein